jgi:hypothetical protein
MTTSFGFGIGPDNDGLTTLPEDLTYDDFFEALSNIDPSTVAAANKFLSTEDLITGRGTDVQQMLQNIYSTPGSQEVIAPYFEEFSRQNPELAAQLQPYFEKLVDPNTPRTVFDTKSFSMPTTENNTASFLNSGVNMSTAIEPISRLPLDPDENIARLDVSGTVDIPDDISILRDIDDATIGDVSIKPPSGADLASFFDAFKNIDPIAAAALLGIPAIASALSGSGAGTAASSAIPTTTPPPGTTTPPPGTTTPPPGTTTPPPVTTTPPPGTTTPPPGTTTPPPTTDTTTTSTSPNPTEDELIRAGLPKELLPLLLKYGLGALASYLSYKSAKDAQEQARGASFTEKGPVTSTRRAYQGSTYKPAAQGGLMTLAGGGMTAKQPFYLGGPTDGMADEVPAHIDNKRPAALSDGEFVIPADVVSHLGNGNSNAGASRLYEMMDRVREARTGNRKQGIQINPNKFMPR